jgi:hypothetical protein
MCRRYSQTFVTNSAMKTHSVIASVAIMGAVVSLAFDAKVE